MVRMKMSLQGRGHGSTISTADVKHLKCCPVEGRVDILSSDGRIQPPEWIFLAPGWPKCALSRLSPSIQEREACRWE